MMNELSEDIYSNKNYDDLDQPISFLGLYVQGNNNAWPKVRIQNTLLVLR
jgi:hypothetical protein